MADLVRKIMKAPTNDHEKKLDEAGEYYPLDAYKDDTLARYYSGARALSEATARKILSQLDEDRFLGGIVELTDDTLAHIGEALKEKEIDIPDNNVPRACTTLFVSILQNCANKPRNQKKKSPEKQAGQVRSVSDTESPSACVESEGSAQLEMRDKEAAQSPPQEPLYEYFASAVAGFPIEKFLDSDPADSLPDYLIRDAVTFWGHIDAELKREHTLDRTNETYKSIDAFIDALKDYLGFLMAHSRRPDAFPDDFHFNTGDSEIAHKANSDRANLKNVFNIANAAIKAESEKIDRERADITHTHAGEYLRFSL